MALINSRPVEPTRTTWRSKELARNGAALGRRYHVATVQLGRQGCTARFVHEQDSVAPPEHLDWNVLR